MSTGGDCTGPGEEICGGVCVNTQENPDHCGKCFNKCEFEACIEGECMVILPYGAPMPEPLWI
jgi:hypothetical protein